MSSGYERYVNKVIIPLIIWVGVELMKNHNPTQPPNLACKNKIENDPKLLKNSEGNRDDEWNFCWGQETDIALFLRTLESRNLMQSSLR